MPYSADILCQIESGIQYGFLRSGAKRIKLFKAAKFKRSFWGLKSGLSEAAFEAKVYPNPAHNQITLEWLSDVRIRQINLLDLTGKKILSYNVSGVDRSEINVEKLPAGAYIFQFMGDDVIKPVVWMKN